MSDTPSVEPIFVSVKDAAAILAISPWAVYKLLGDGEIDCQYHGSRRLVRLASLRSYADNLPTEAPIRDASA